MKAEKDFEELLQLFNRHEVRYCIVGSFAVAFHARPRYTKDMDILVDTGRENAARIVKALVEFGFSELGLEEGDFMEQKRIIQLGYEPVRIDIMTSLDGCTFEEVWNNRLTGKYGDEKVNFIGLDELIRNKKTSDRKQDEADLELLLSAERAGK